MCIRDSQYGNVDWSQREKGAANVEKYISVYRKTKCVAAKVLGFQELYFIASSQLNTEVEFDPKSDSKADIKRAFTKSLKGKANNKKILSSFIEQIA